MTSKQRRRPRVNARTVDEMIFTDNPVPDNVEDEDEITRIMLDRLKSHRKNPMSEQEILDAHARIRDAFGDAPTDTRKGDDSTANDSMTGPFIRLCGKLADAVTPAHYKPSSASNKRIQRALFIPTPELANSLLYTAGEAIFAPIRYMLEMGKVQKTSPNGQGQLANSGLRTEDRATVQKLIALVERMTGLGLEGAIAARAQGVLCLVFDHLDTPQFAALVVLRVSTDSIPAMSMNNGSTLGPDFGYELFDAPYLTREDTSNSPWAALPAAYVDTFYFNRIEAPYGRLIADTRNS